MLSWSLPLLLQCDKTALMIAAQWGHLGVVRQLISSGASVNANDTVSIKSQAAYLCCIQSKAYLYKNEEPIA